MLPDFRVRQRDYLLEISRALTQELDLVRAELAAVSAPPASAATETWPPVGLVPPVDLSPSVDAYPYSGQYEPEDPPEYAAVVRQIELPETPPIWAGPPVTWVNPAEAPLAETEPVAETAMSGEWSGFSLDIPLVAASAGDGRSLTVELDDVSLATARPAPLIDTVPTVTRRAS